MFQTDAEKVYYQGNLETKDIPWNIAIQYSLNGNNCPAEELAGADGKLEIRISITENKSCDKSFFEGYALQASLSLDTDKCKNIQAQDATIANVGSDKQLSYIILPGKEKELLITADVSDFEMDGISMNGTKLNMNIDFDDSELQEKIQDIQDAVTELDDGAKELNDGAKKLSKGSKKVYNGSRSLKKGAGSLNSGMNTLNKGIKSMQTALKTLDESVKFSL